MCSALYNGIRLERAKQMKYLLNTIADVEINLMDKELNHHAIKCIGDASHRFNYLSYSYKSSKLSRNYNDISESF
jgi:hypothetical protein